MKKLLIVITLIASIFLVPEVFAATRTIADGGGNWSSTGTWVEGAVPTASDDVVATATSGQITVDTTTCVCKTLVLTNYVNTMTFTVAMKLTVSGSVTFVSGITLSGTGTLAMATGTLTMGELTFPGNFQPNNSVTITLAGTLNITGSLMLLNCTFVGAYNITCGNFMQTNPGSTTVTYVSGTTLTVTTGLYIGGLSTVSALKGTPTIKSSTASSPVYLVYQGIQANSNIIGGVFTDIDASGSAISLYNYQGGTLTRTANIFNIVLPPQSSSKVY